MESEQLWKQEVERNGAEAPTRVGAAGGGGIVCLKNKTSHKQWPKMSANSEGERKTVEGSKQQQKHLYPITVWLPPPPH